MNKTGLRAGLWIVTWNLQKPTNIIANVSSNIHGLAKYVASPVLLSSHTAEHAKTYVLAAWLTA